MTAPSHAALMTAPPGPATPAARARRVTGVDLARGLALFGMMAVHAFPDYTEHGPTATGLIASGRSAATFALVAGISVAFLSGGRQVLHGRSRRAAAVGLAVRALGIAAIGLLLGYTGSGIDLILAYYAVFFLCAIPLIGLSPRVLAASSVTLVAVGPLLLVAAAKADLPDSGTPEPTFHTLLTEPVGLLVQVLLTGDYPAVAYLAYLCAGLAIGRLDLASRRLATWLLGGGVALAVAAQSVSAVLLHPLGGLDRLVDMTGEDATTLLWSPEQGSSWWYLALASPHAHTQLDLVNALGSAMAVLGASLLVTRIAVVDRALAPVRAAGAMTLTLYSAHVLVFAAGLLHHREVALYLLLVAGSLVFASVRRRRGAQGPLEELVGRAAGRARRAVLLGSATPADVAARE